LKYQFFFFRNPEPGVLRNKPNGTNVYEGVPIDYTGEVSTIWRLFTIIC